MTGLDAKDISETDALRSGIGPLHLAIHRVQQINLCGCGLAALEMVLRYYGAGIGQLDFLSTDKRLRRRVEREDPKGLPESTVAVLALKRGFRVSVYGEKIRAGKTFLKLGGRMVERRADKQLIVTLLQRGIPPVVKIPNAAEVYREEVGSIPHYVVVNGVSGDGSLEVADPLYDEAVPKDYWDRWSGSLIVVEGRVR